MSFPLQAYASTLVIGSGAGKLSENLRVANPFSRSGIVRRPNFKNQNQFAGALADSALAKPRTVLLVHLFDVLEKPIVQLAQQGTQMQRLAVLQPVRRLQDLGQHSMVFRAVLIQACKPGLLHQLLLAPEVHAGEFDELVEEFADPFMAGAAHQRQAELVDGVHEDAVLIVHGTNAYHASVVPSEKSQMSLHE
jgi:hypothetical protein